MSLLCPECSAHFEDGWKTCPNCGANVDPNALRRQEELAKDLVTARLQADAVEAPPVAIPADSTWHMNFDAALDAVSRDDFKSALTAMNKAILAAPDEHLAECHSTRGYIYLCLEDFARAEDDCSAAIRLAPHDSESLAWRGSARASRQKWRQAVEDLTQAINLTSHDVDHYRKLRETYANHAIESFRHQVREGHASAQLFFDRGSIYYLIGDNDKANRDFSQALEKDERHIASLIGRSRVWLDQGEYVNVINDCTQALETGPDSVVEALKLRAQAHQYLGDFSEALDDLNDLKKATPGSAQAFHECGLIRQQMGDLVGAIADQTSAIELDPQLVDAYRNRGEAYAAMRNHDLAIEDFDRALELSGDDSDALVSRGQSYLNKRDLKRAMDDFNEALHLDEVNAHGYLGRARVLASQGQREQALFECDRALRLDSRFSEAYAMRGRIHYDEKNYDQAINDFTRALKLETRKNATSEHYYRRAVAYLDQGRLDMALADFDASIALRPNHAGTYIWRCNTYTGLKRWTEAILDLQRAIEINPADARQYRQMGGMVGQRAVDHFTEQIKQHGELPLLLVNRASAYHFLNNLEKATEDYQRALEIDPEHIDARLGVARVQMQKRQNQEVVETITELVDDRQRRSSKAYALRSRAYFRLGRKRDAYRDAKRAVRLSPNDPKLLILRGELLIALHRFQRAERDLTQAIAMDYTLHEAFAYRGQCHMSQSKFLDAIHDFSYALELNPNQPVIITRRGEAYLKNGQIQLAKADFDDALKRERKLIRAYCGRALVMARAGMHERALIWLTKAIHKFERREDWAELLHTRARIFYNMQRYGRAITDYTTLVKWNISDVSLASALYARGLSYLQEDNMQKARDDFEASLKANRRYRPAKRALLWLSGESTAKPEALDGAPSLVRPTRPRVVRVKSEIVSEQGVWKAKPPFDQWVVKTVEGEEFGPVPKVLLDNWFREGRIDQHSKLLRSDWTKWRNADEIYADLAANGIRRGKLPTPALPSVHEIHPAEVGEGKSNGSGTPFPEKTEEEQSLMDDDFPEIKS